MGLESPLAEALVHAALEIDAAPDVETTLDAIVHTAQRSLPGVDHVGISIAHRNGTIETKSGTDQLVWELDQVQYELREGPCVHAIEGDNVVVAADIRHEQRWPQYVPRAVERGVKAQVGLRLYVDHETLGGLNLYSTQAEFIDPDVVHTAELFAAYASLALGRARREETLQAGMQTRKLIGQAIGMIMERYGIDEDRAFEYLVRVSQHSNIKLRDIAQELVSQGNHRAHQRAEERVDNRPGSTE
jgi:GAF domain-containing protein